MTSSRNAVRHGLCCPLPFDIAQFDRIALAFAKAGDPTLVADDLAHSYLEMERIRRVRRQMLASLFEVWSPGEFKRLAKLDRYERSALKKAIHAGNLDAGVAGNVEQHRGLASEELS